MADRLQRCGIQLGRQPMAPHTFSLTWSKQFLSRLLVNLVLMDKLASMKLVHASKGTIDNCRGASCTA